METNDPTIDDDEKNDPTVGDDEEEEEANDRNFEDQFVAGNPTVDYEEEGARNPNFNAPVVAGGGREGELEVNDPTFKAPFFVGDGNAREIGANDATMGVGQRLVSQSDDFYINNLLWPKIQNRLDFRCKEDVTDVDLVGEPEPVGFLNSHATSSLIPMVYFYKDRRQLSKPDPNAEMKPHFIRSAGNAFGKWTLNHTDKVMVGERQIGQRSTLSYHPRTNNGEANFPHHQQYTYNMIEYSVMGETMTLCRMTRFIRSKKTTNTNKKKNEKNTNKKNNKADHTTAVEGSQENNESVEERERMRGDKEVTRDKEMMRGDNEVIRDKDDADLVDKVDANAVGTTAAATSQESDENVVVDAEKNQKADGVDCHEIVNQNIAGVGEVERGGKINVVAGVGEMERGGKTNVDTLEDDVQLFNDGEGGKSKSGITISTISAIDALIETGGATLTKPPPST